MTPSTLHRRASRTTRSCLVSAAAVLAGLIVASCGGSPSSPSPPYAPFSQQDIFVGQGREAQPGLLVIVDYIGWLYDPDRPEQKGREFDSSLGGLPIGFVLGAGQVIPGWDQGLVGMRVDGVRRLIIPPELAYGAAGAGGGLIPPNATLIFDIQLLDVQDAEDDEA